MAAIALQEYADASANVAALRKLEAGYADPPGPGDKEYVEGLRGAAVVLMVAAFENYLKQAFTESLEQINLATPPCDFEKLPIALRTHAVFIGLEYAMKGGPGSPSLSRDARLPDVLQAVKRINDREIISEGFAKTGGNPDTAQVKQIFKMVDYPTPFTRIKSAFDAAWGTPTAVTFVEDTLDTIVGRRHVVAHTASILSTSRGDVANWHRFLDLLVAVLDAALERQIARIIARAQ